MMSAQEHAAWLAHADDPRDPFVVGGWPVDEPTLTVVTSAEHSWRPIDLVAAASNPPEPPTIGGLLYPGKRTLLSGETETSKRGWR
jgi:hypothetical protein